MSRLGVVVALPAEARTLVNTRIQPGGRARFGDGFIELCGIGSARARTAADALLGAGATALLSWGTAGGLDVALVAGSLVLPKTVISSAGEALHVDPDWRERVCRRLAGYVAYSHGPLIESPAILGQPADKCALFEATGATAVDMESAAVADVARGGGVPFLAVRAVLDSAARLIPAGILSAIEPSGRLRGFSLLHALVARPRTLVDLLQLRADLRTAHATLAEVARLTAPDVAAG